MTAVVVSSRTNRFADFRELSKSGIVFLVLINVIGGYLIGQPAEAPWEPMRLFWTILGVFFLAAGSSALNQLQEYRLDAEMPRTAGRPLPSGRISPIQALLFVVIFLVLGLSILRWRVNEPVFWLGVAATLSYNGLYTLWWKKHWAYAAVPGAIPGALPVLMGFVAANGNLWHPGGIYLFAILFYWQMPHFWVLALRYKDDYSKASFPTLPVAKGEGVTLHQIRLWSLGYIGLALIAPLFLKVGALYLLFTLTLSAKVLWELRHFLRQAEATDIGKPGNKAWLRFFLWINFSQMILIFAAALDLWSLHLVTPLWLQ